MSRHIVIDHIMLDGFDFSAEQQDEFRARLSNELERRFSDTWVDALSDRRDGSAQAQPLEIGEKAQPVEIATQVASRIVEGLKG